MRRRSERPHRSRLPRAVALWCGLAVQVCRAGGARAAEPRDVEALIGEGMDLRREGKDERALPFFQKAYGIEHTPRSAGQLGLAEMAVGYWLSAETHLAEALDSPGHPWIAKNQATLSSSLERVRKRIGEVTIAGGPAGARVVLNGQEVGSMPLPAPLRVGEGRVQVEISARGYVSAVKTFHLAGGGKERVLVTLGSEPPRPAPIADSVPGAVAHPPAAVAPPAPTGATPAALPGPSAPPTASAPLGDTPTAPGGPGAPGGGGQAGEGEGRSGGGRGGRAIAYGAGAVAVGSLVFAVIETIRWQKKETEFRDHGGCGEDDPARGAAGCQPIYDSGKLAWKLSLTGYGVGAALAAGAVYLFVTSDDGARAPGPQARQQSPTCLPHLDLAAGSAAGVNCQFRF